MFNEINEMMKEIEKLSEERLNDATKIQNHFSLLRMSVGEIAKANEESAVNLNTMSDQVYRTLETSSKLRDSVDQMKSRLDDFNNASCQIVNIASQTNLLSLKAENQMNKMNDGVAQILALVEELSAKGQEILASVEEFGAK